ncbi:MAG: lamin tail domain-containing protein, partial [Candidatus Curtissbacteria bacterium]|nr:lamin tail domain-containing protein [Candidatus Curtissbacteria bacterium]
MKKILISLTALILFLVYPKSALANIYINEFLPSPSSGQDWVELYNTDGESVNLEGWVLDDEGTSTNMFEIHDSTISAHGFLTFDVGTRLNKTEDTIYLKNKDSQEVDSYHYGTDLGDDVSFGRMPDGSNWGICQNLTKGASNSCTAATPTPAPTNTPTPQLENPTPTPTTKPSPTPTKKPTPTPTLEPTPTQSEEQVFAQTEEVTPTATPAV